MSPASRWFSATRNIVVPIGRAIRSCRIRDIQPDSIVPDGSGCRYDASSIFSCGSYRNGNCSAYFSVKKSNGLMTVRSATRSTVNDSSRVRSGNTKRAT